MRLLNVHTLQFRDFYGIPEPYIVTSHRWSAGNEAMLEDVKHGRRRDTTGFKKIEGFAKFVRKNFPHVDWIWIDTCCVNQESDREVSEAVNSMFRWYSRAECCLAYLPDVNRPGDMDQFGRSDWFHRGWTLQELLAPESGLEPAIADITAIPICVLEDYSKSKDYSVETRLAWMTGRETTREEDMVYSLFGIFDVTLPVIYGETAVRAKRRLLKEIADVSAPFASNVNPSNYNDQPLLKDSPVRASDPTASSEEGTQRDTIRIRGATNKVFDTEHDEADLLMHGFAEAALIKGNTAFGEEDYFTAKSQYREALELIAKLPTGPRQDELYNLPLIDYRLAVCAFHVDEPMKAETALSVVIRAAKCEPLELCEASHLLSQVLAMRGKLEDAATSCKSNYYERRRLLGKDNMICYGSLALLSRIHKLMGDEREALRYLSIIPEDAQDPACRPFNTVWPPVQRQWDFKKLSDSVAESARDDSVRSPCATFSHNSRLLACTIPSKKTMRVWDVTSGAEKVRINPPRNDLHDIAISRDCRYIAAVSRDHTVFLWNIETQNDAVTYRACFGFWAEGVAFSSEDKLLVVECNGVVRFLTDIVPRYNLVILTKQGDRSKLCAKPVIFPNGKWTATASMDGTISVWNLASRIEVKRLEGEGKLTTQIAISAHGGQLVLWSDDKSLRTWDISSGHVVKKLEEAVFAKRLAFSPALDLLAYGPRGEHGDLTTLRMIASRAKLALRGSVVAFSPDGEVIVVMKKDGDTELRAVESLRNQFVLKSPGVQDDFIGGTNKPATPEQKLTRSSLDAPPSRFTISKMFKCKFRR